MNTNDPANNDNAAENNDNARQDSIAVQNIERLLSTSYEPEVPSAEFLERVQQAMLDQAQHRDGRKASPAMGSQYQLIRQIAGFALAGS